LRIRRLARPAIEDDRHPPGDRRQEARHKEAKKRVHASVSALIDLEGRESHDQRRHDSGAGTGRAGQRKPQYEDGERSRDDREETHRRFSGPKYAEPVVKEQVKKWRVLEWRVDEIPDHWRRVHRPDVAARLLVEVEIAERPDLPDAKPQPRQGDESDPARSPRAAQRSDWVGSFAHQRSRVPSRDSSLRNRTSASSSSRRLAATRSATRPMRRT